MAYEKCPQCGADKHQLKACAHCGFVKNPVHRIWTTSARDAPGLTSSQSAPKAATSVALKTKQAIQAKRTRLGAVGKAGRKKRHTGRSTSYPSSVAPEQQTKPIEYQLTPEEAKKLREAMRDNKLVGNEAIRKYLREHPYEEKKPFGEPQDKYRWGFYGSRSMEYDVWGRGDKRKK